MWSGEGSMPFGVENVSKTVGERVVPLDDYCFVASLPRLFVMDKPIAH